MSEGDRLHTSIHIDPPTDERIRSFLSKLNVMIFTCTYYETTKDLHFHQCLETLQNKFGANSVPVVVVFGVGMHFYHHTWLRWLCCRLTTTKNEDFLLFLDFLSFFGAGMHFYLHAWLRWFAVGWLRNISENGGQLGSQPTAKSL